jgi:putative acetyltransferase
MDIKPGGLDDPRVVALLRHHFDTCHAVTPPGSTHVLDLSKLKSSDVDFWSAWDGDELLAVGAMKRLSDSHGEVKSMHTAEAARRRGAGSEMLRHIIRAARVRGITRLSLETGSFDFFAPARALYMAHGFVECGPFGDYRLDPNSVFLTLALDGT